MLLFKKLGTIMCCAAITLGSFNVAYAATDITTVDNVAELSNCEAGTYQIVEEDSQGTLTTTYIIGEEYTVDGEESTTDGSVYAFSLASTASTSARNFTQINSYTNANDVLIYRTTNDCTFYYDGTNVWVADCTKSEYHNSSCIKTLISTTTDATKGARQYAWSRYQINYTYGSTVFNTVNDVGCSRYGDSMYIKE